MKNRSTTISLSLVFTVFLVGAYVFSPAVDANQSDATGSNILKRGGQLYDKWYTLTGTTPQGNHPLYPGNGEKSGETTWRCKECHGWDYIGKGGRYATGSHFTGIEGTFSARGKAEAEIRDALAGRDHALAGKLASRDIDALIAFIKNGQIDISNAITPDGSGRGSSENGQELYDANCRSCHGMNGNAIDFNGKMDGIQGVGWLANDNPQETLHKIRWGHPGSDMPSMIADLELSDGDTIDILTYSQTLDK